MAATRLSSVVFALLGENGAGKTTTIKLLLGLEEADTGKIKVLGLDSRREGAEIRRRVGYVPEQPALYQWMTAAEIGWFAAGFYPPGFEHEYRTIFGAGRVENLANVEGNAGQGVVGACLGPSARVADSR